MLLGSGSFRMFGLAFFGGGQWLGVSDVLAAQQVLGFRVYLALQTARKNSGCCAF